MPQIGKKVRDAVRTVLADGTNGFNPIYSALRSAYGDPPVTVFDFTSTSKNFAHAQIDAATVDVTSVYNYPLMLLYGQESENTRDRKFAIFAGRFVIGMDVYISYPNSSLAYDMESWADGIEDAMYSVFNGAFGTGVFTSAGVIYNGELAMIRQPVRTEGENWLQQLGFRATFMI